MLLVPGPLSSRLRNPVFMGLLLTPVYVWHNWEEHAWDMRGWRYAFMPWFNATVGKKRDEGVLIGTGEGFEEDIYCEATP